MSDEQKSLVILRASETGRDLKPAISAVFVDGFYQWLNQRDAGLTRSAHPRLARHALRD